MANGESLIAQGVDLMIYGMGTVFVFLTLLVLAVTLLSAAVRRWLPEPVPAPPAPRQVDTPPVDAHLRAIIQAAIDQHRNR